MVCILPPPPLLFPQYVYKKNPLASHLLIIKVTIKRLDFMLRHVIYQLQLHVCSQVNMLLFGANFN